MTKKQFERLGIVYEEQSLEENPLVLEGFKAQGLVAAPIVTTDKKAWSGFRPDKIQSLDRYLKSHGEK
jgi:arsenate reductase-like glutaredoxin family protein